MIGLPCSYPTSRWPYRWPLASGALLVVTQTKREREQEGPDARQPAELAAAPAFHEG